ncbi:hypothetical protein ACFPRL_01645 [Pseudoclavibacter helvolus]
MSTSIYLPGRDPESEAAKAADDEITVEAGAGAEAEAEADEDEVKADLDDAEETSAQSAGHDGETSEALPNSAASEKSPGENEEVSSTPKA